MTEGPDPFPVPTSVCGDGIVAWPEECDRGDVNGEDSGCSGVCRLEESACDREGARECVSPVHVQVCRVGKWQIAEDCEPRGRLCGGGDCVEPPECAEAGTSACAGDLVLFCVGDAWEVGRNCADMGLRCLEGTCISGPGEGEGEERGGPSDTACPEGGDPLDCSTEGGAPGEGEGEGEEREGTGGTPGTACPEGRDPLDCSAEGGCEREGPDCTSGEGEGEGEGEDCVPVAEVCDGVDNDCDGRTDEDFDLDASLEHCGECDLPCDLLQADAVCAGGQCLIARCAAGFIDADRLDDSGCEAEDEGRIIYVDDDQGVGGDGTEGTPFPDIASAVANADPGDTILVAAGLYQEQVVLDVQSLTLRGADRETTLLMGDGANPTVELRADFTQVADLTVNANDGPAAVLVTCQDQCAVLDCRIEQAHGQAGAPNSGGGLANGILLRGAGWAKVGRNEIVNVVGGAGGRGVPAAGGRAAGVRLEGSHDAVIFGNSVSGVTGGVGGVSSGGGNTGGVGGPAIAIDLVDTRDSRVVGTLVRGLAGGRGGPAPTGTAGVGGHAAGVALSASSGNVVAATVVEELSGGERGDGFPVGLPGPTYGMWIGPGGLDNRVSPSNRTDAGPVVYVHGTEAVEVAGYRLVAGTPGTNLGGIVVLASRDVLVRNNEVAGLVGDPGTSGRHQQVGGGAGRPTASSCRTAQRSRCRTTSWRTSRADPGDPAGAKALAGGAGSRRGSASSGSSRRAWRGTRSGASPAE